MMSELIHKAEGDIEGLRQRLACSGAGSACSAINVSRSAKLLHAARSLDAGDADTDAAAAAATGGCLRSEIC